MSDAFSFTKTVANMEELTVVHSRQHLYVYIYWHGVNTQVPILPVFICTKVNGQIQAEFTQFLYKCYSWPLNTELSYITEAELFSLSITNPCFLRMSQSQPLQTCVCLILCKSATSSKGHANGL